MIDAMINPPHLEWVVYGSFNGQRGPVVVEGSRAPFPDEASCHAGVNNMRSLLAQRAGKLQIRNGRAVHVDAQGNEMPPQSQDEKMANLRLQRPECESTLSASQDPASLLREQPRLGPTQDAPKQKLPAVFVIGRIDNGRFIMPMTRGTENLENATAADCAAELDHVANSMNESILDATRVDIPAPEANAALVEGLKAAFQARYSCLATPPMAAYVAPYVAPVKVPLVLKGQYALIQDDAQNGQLKRYLRGEFSSIDDCSKGRERFMVNYSNTISLFTGNDPQFAQQLHDRAMAKEETMVKCIPSRQLNANDLIDYRPRSQ